MAVFMSKCLCTRFDLGHWIFINEMKFLTSLIQAEIFRSFYSALLPLTQFLTLIQHRLLRSFQRASNNAISNELSTQSKVFITKLAILSQSQSPTCTLKGLLLSTFFILRTNQLMNHNIAIMLIIRQTLALFTFLIFYIQF